MPDPPGTEWLKTANRPAPLFIYGQPQGLRSPGNLDLYARPVVRNPEGGISTVLSMSISTDKGSYLIPRVVGNRILSPREAIQHFRQTGENLGLFDSDANADAYAKALHEQQDRYYRGRSPSPQSQHDPSVQPMPMTGMPTRLPMTGMPGAPTRLPMTGMPTRLPSFDPSQYGPPTGAEITRPAPGIIQGTPTYGNEEWQPQGTPWAGHTWGSADQAMAKDQTPQQPSRAPPPGVNQPPPATGPWRSPQFERHGIKPNYDDI